MKNVNTRGLEQLKAFRPLGLCHINSSVKCTELNRRIHVHTAECLLSSQLCVSRPRARALWTHSDKAQWLLAAESGFSSRVITSCRRKSPSCQMTSAKSL